MHPKKIRGTHKRALVFFAENRRPNYALAVAAMAFGASVCLEWLG
jgi:hypothetical protein